MILLNLTKPVFFCIHLPGLLATIFITSMAVSVLTTPVSVLISVTLFVSIFVFHASVSVIQVQISNINNNTICC